MDFYELTMANGYFESGMHEQVAYFDMFFRKVPDNGGFIIMAGLEQLIKYLVNLKFDESDVLFLKSQGVFSEGFIHYLQNFKFSCDVWAVPEGTPVFAGEPVITVRGPVVQAQLIETMLLLTINHQSLIATKANRIVRSAGGRIVSEFGSRRAHGCSAAVCGARAAYIGGCDSTACTLASDLFGIKVSGTMAHSWVQMFPSELEAFRAYAKMYPSNCILLVDTYNTLKSGIPNAIKVFNEEILPRGFRPKAIRIDSGDVTYLSKMARAVLDTHGFKDCQIIASGSLDEFSISSMISGGAKVDFFGVGEKLITSASSPVSCGVYKLCAVEKGSNLIPKMKISNDVSKINTPCFKEVWRFYDKTTKKAQADVVTLFDEKIDDSKPYNLFDPSNPWKRKLLKNFDCIKIRKKIFDKGKLVYDCPSLHKIRSYCLSQMDTLWDEVKRLYNPHKYYVDLSEKLWKQKQELLSKTAL